MNWILIPLFVACCVGVQPHLQFTSNNKMTFNMAGVNIHSAGNGEVRVELPEFASDWAVVTATEVGEPSLSSLQNAVILSTGDKPTEWDWQVVVTNVTYMVQPISGTVAPRQPFVSRCGNSTATRVGVTYANDDAWYPKQHSIAELHSFHTFRDVHGALLRINPVQYNAARQQLRILTHCEITLVSTSQLKAAAVPRKVDMDFAKLYQFIYGNAVHHQQYLLPQDAPGTLLIITEKRFQSQADTYAANVKATGVTVVQHTWDGSSTAAQLKTNVVAPQYKQSLAYLVLLGKKLPFFVSGKGQDQDACDQCYGQLNGGTDQTVDIAVTRLSVDTTDDAEGQIAKFKAYQGTSTESWNKVALGTATKDAFDDDKNLQTDTKILQAAGFKCTYVEAKPKNKQQAIDAMNQGAAIWEFMGDGSGTEVAQLGFSVNDVSKLKNDGKPFVFFDTACLNAQFQKLHPSLNEALMSHSPGGALATLGGTEEETGPSWTEQKCAFQIIQNKGATRLGPWMTGALMCMFKGQKSEATFSLTERVVFGDPTMTLALLQ